MSIKDVLIKRSVAAVSEPLISNAAIRRLVFGYVEKALYRETYERGPMDCSHQALQDRLDCVSALLNGVDRAMRRGIISRNAVRAILEAFIGNILLGQGIAEAEKRLGYEPPGFITISPTGRCNLKCRGCYASDAALCGGRLDFATVERIIREKEELWGSHFTVISGGEPFLWSDNGLGLVELAKRFPQQMFLVYTNGTMLDDALARRVADAGNITPAFSVEGFKEETDGRRGDGTYDRVLAAMARARDYGIPFGVSATATGGNWQTIVSDRFADFYFDEQGAVYCWIFQYMPIGRSQSLDLVVPPEARAEMFRRMWQLVREKKRFMVDFWNSGSASLGCIAAARGTGYFYINWDGDITPCVFAPYAAGNIRDVYASGGSLCDVVDFPLFRAIREWQESHGYARAVTQSGNWLCPCAVRDHYGEFAEMVRRHGGRPINDEARQALEDPSYHSGMTAYGARMHELFDPLWQAGYMRPLAEAAAEKRVQSNGK